MKHRDNRRIAAAIPKRWEELSALGMTKDKAAEVLAVEFQQKAGTIRKKLLRKNLQGLLDAR